jgi:hypothetical protein
MRLPLILLAFQLSFASSGHAQESVSETHPGRLGYNLGTPLVLEGTCLEKGKGGNKSLEVKKVNGKSLEVPIGIWVENVSELPKNTLIVLKGYETGKMIGGDPKQQAVRQFYRYFVVTEVVRPKSLKVIKSGS